MELNKIKLAGFKSFVDPVSVPIPSNLVAVVGPNGCGKSNIIDAVCWVLGESSAKYLRGESLTDVIFNGSTARKPVGQASVELIFDNKDGSIGGEYAKYSEVSIRRVINRDADSSWFLNGTRCRRRDIVDIFLGTGLGPRSYSIIGQNMISRVVESKPDEMRNYLEEAAGISRYRERRRETENRIMRTRENMSRLDDIKCELDRQLDTLKRQADAANKFKLLKQEERMMRATSLALQWRELDVRRVQQSLQIQQQETGLEAKQADILEIDFAIDQRRDDQKSADAALQEIQHRFYSVSNEITKIEQNINHSREREQQWKEEKAQAVAEQEKIEKNIEEIRSERGLLEASLKNLQPELVTKQGQAGKADLTYKETEKDLHIWQTRWEEFNGSYSKAIETVRVEQARIVQLEQRLFQLVSRGKELDIDKNKDKSVIACLETSAAEVDQSITVLSLRVEEEAKSLANLKEKMLTVREKQLQIGENLDDIRKQKQSLHGKKASLEALQQTALGQRDDVVTKWLAKCGLAENPRLAQRLSVSEGWESVVENILGIRLQAVCVKEFNQLTSKLDVLPEGNFCGFSTDSSSSLKETTGVSSVSTMLVDCIKSDWPLVDLLAGIYIADTLDEALVISKKLAPQESVVTPDGVWLGPSWVQVLREDNPAAGVFQREQELKINSHNLENLSNEQGRLETEMDLVRKNLLDYEKLRDTTQENLNKSSAEIATLKAKQISYVERIQEIKVRVDRFLHEQELSANQRGQIDQELETAKEKLQIADNFIIENTDTREKLITTRDELRNKVVLARRTAEELVTEVHQKELNLQTEISRYENLQKILESAEIQLSANKDRHLHLLSDFSLIMPMESLQGELNSLLNQRMDIEAELNVAKVTTETLAVALGDNEIKRQCLDKEATAIRNRLETLRLEGEGFAIRADALQEQITGIGIRLEDLLSELPELDVGILDDYQLRLDRIQQRIRRLGAINLVAIEEYTACQERKQYLDRQYADLRAGLETLESAINKIDKETRIRFKETYDQVNASFQELFPRIFGGGRAYMELTCDNLLEAGIRIMACPPGKRNSTIHLLSGGEKAMTAIALVFSIFQLNPAPFCMLDEVDAPLDDANIGRFCELVKSMSEKTQFIFISHNKLAIEMSEHLLGVTMNEPGVSRLVAVDVEEAVRLSEE